MVAPLAAFAIGSAISAAPALFGKKRKASAPDISRLLGTIQSGADRQRQIAAGLEPRIQKRLSEFETGSREAFGEFKTGALRQIDEGRESLSDLRNIQGSQLARTLQEQAFRPVRGATEFVRQNLATTRTGASQEALAAPAIQAQQQFGQALNDLTQQVLKGDIDLANQANAQKLNLIESEFGFEQGIISEILQRGSEADKALIQEFLDIQNQQTANELQAIQFGLSGQLAADAANNAARADRDSSIFGAGGNLLGSIIAARGGGSTTAPSTNPGLSTQAVPNNTFGFPGNRLGLQRPDVMTAFNQ